MGTAQAGDHTPPHAGLRERKKALRRRAISDVATHLFVEHGFDEVTLADVAEAAQVSIKTIFNHFGSKEDLFLDREGELHQAVIDAVAERPAGRSITEALAALLSDNRIPVAGDRWELLRDGTRYEHYRRFLSAWQGSPALCGRSLMGDERLREHLTAAIAAEHRRDPPDDAVRTMAAMIVAAMQLRHRVLARAMLERAAADEVERRVRALVAEAFGRVATAFPDLDLRRQARPAATRAGGPGAPGVTS